MRRAILLFGFALVAAIACGDDEDAGPGTKTVIGDASVDGPVPPVRSEFGLEVRPANKTCKAPARPPSAATIKMQQVYANAGGFTFPEAPMAAAQRPGDGSRWYVAKRNGDIVYFASSNPTGVTLAATLRTNDGKSIPQAPGIVEDGEGGLLNFVFHPNFAQNGKAYVSFTAAAVSSGTMSSLVAEISSPDGGNTWGGYKELLRFDQTAAINHKGGGLAISKDGFLYASFGDGGGADDEYTKGQTKTGYFSKIVRFAVDGDAKPEIHAMGFRNPFRISVDRESGELWVGDVGQNNWEEIDRVKQGGNYGWPCREGTHDYITSPEHCPSVIGLQAPVIELEHEPRINTRSITGGVVYHGKAMPSLVGSYLFGDYLKHDFYVLSLDPGTGAPKQTSVDVSSFSATWVGFAEDADGEVYGLSIEDSRMYKVVPAAAQTGTPFPDRLSKTGCKDTDGLVPYGVNSELWSDGAAKSRYIALPDDAKITVGANGDFDLPIGSVVVKTFELASKTIETRLLVRHDDGGWAGYSYEWLDDGSDAVLLGGSKSKPVGSQTWFYPSRSDCPSCHTEVAGRTLGLELGQLNGEFVYDSTNRQANQLKTLEHIGMFSAPLGKLDTLAVYPPPKSDAPVEARARAYLHANCSACHQPNGPGRGDWDLRFATTLADTKVCNASPQGENLGVAGAKLLFPGHPEKSLISLRPHAAGANRMPPLATSIVDTSGLGVLDEWIGSLKGCP
jgi:uncharacterized repeat protein (TIGR03806 family)